MPAPGASSVGRRSLGFVALILTLGWFFTLLATWSEISVLVESGFSSAALSVLGHQLGRWTVVTALFVGLWVILFKAATRSGLPSGPSSIVASTFAILPLLCFEIYRASLAQGIYFGDFLSRSFLQFALDAGAKALLTWAVTVVAVDLWRRGSDKGRGPAVPIITCSLLVLFVLAIILGRLSRAQSDADQPPNVILIVIDALRPDHLGSYGYHRPTSSSIDEIAAQGIQFDTAISQSTLTKTSIASLFTGLNPHHHGVYSGHRLTDGMIYSDTLPGSLRTLATELQAAGYLTAAWLQQSQLKAASGYDRGFLFYNEDSRDIGTINRRFLAWVDRIGQSAPIFAYLHYIDLHDPYRPSPPYDELYGDTDAVGNKLDHSSWKRTLQRIQTGEMELTRRDIDALIDLYDGQITFIDKQLGRLFDNLRGNQYLDSSMVILTSDHGDGFMEHGFISHSVKPYDELIRVPLLLRLPRGESAGLRVDKQVRLIDVMPSILGHLELPIPEGLDGGSVWEWIEGDSPVPLAISEVEMQGDGGYEFFASIRSRDWKLIGTNEAASELYDLQSDPGEKNNRIDEPDPVNEQWIDAYQEILRAREALQVDQIPLDEETKERLRTLGYIE